MKFKRTHKAGIFIVLFIIAVIACTFVSNKPVKESEQHTVQYLYSVATEVSSPTQSIVEIGTPAKKEYVRTEIISTKEPATTTTETTTTTTTTTIETTTTEPSTVIVYETTAIKTTEPVQAVEEVYYVYKPSTHYVHKSNCKWVDNTCERITDTSEIEARSCSDCNPEIKIEKEYIEETETQAESSVSSSSGMTYVKHFSRGTFYCYGHACYGGSGRSLIDCSYGSGGVKGSIASSYLYRNYGYNYKGSRTMVYLEVSGYPSMNGYYYLDDSDAGNPNVIDFFFIYSSNCPFQRQGVVGVDCYIVG